MSRSSWLLAAVLLIAAANGVFYAVTIPPWDLYDEGTHLAYALTLRDEQRIPHLEEYTRRDIVESEIETDRWARLRIGRPDTSSLEAMGLGGRLYQGYQPPLYYLMILPATVIQPDDVETTLYLARLLFGPVLLVLLTGITWELTRTWFPFGGSWSAIGAALMMAVTPAAGEAAGRVNNDLLAATLIAAGVLAAFRFARNPTLRSALILGGVSALAVLTKASGMLLLPVVGIALLISWWRGRLSPGQAATAALTPTLAAAGWSLWTYERYGSWTGSGAFLSFARPFEPMSGLEFVESIWFNAWSSYWVTYDGGWIRLGTGLILLVLLAVGLSGLRHLDISAKVWAPALVLMLGFLIMLWYGNRAGFVYPQGRILLPLFPVVAALVAGGWSGYCRPRMALVPATIASLLSIAFLTGWYLPFFHF